MWFNNKNLPARGFSTPPPTWKSKSSSSYSPMMMMPMPMSEKKQRSSPSSKADLFHVIHKIPTGDSPYVRAKHVQLIDRDPSKAISLFWAAINSGDRVDSALKDMAVVMKQLNRCDEAIEAIKSFRHLCPPESQESLDNVLVELYKRSGRIEEEIEMLQRKLKHIEEGIAFGGRRIKIARSQGKKIQITIEQERSRILGNLAWAYLQQNNFRTAEELYRKALFLDPDKNKQCNLAFCLMHMNKIAEAKSLLQAIRASCKNGRMEDSYAKSFERAFQMLTEFDSQSVLNPVKQKESPEEIQRSFTSPSNRNLREFTTSINGGQDKISGFVVSTRCEDGNDEETVLLNERNRGIDCQNHFVSRDISSRYEKGNSEGIFFQPRSSLQASPQTLSVDKWKKGAYHENLPETRSKFSSRRMEVGSTCKKTNASPVYVREYPKAPLTEPRSGSRLFNKGSHQSMGLWGDDAVGSSNRKLSFEQPITIGNVLGLTPQNHNGKLQASINESSKVALGLRGDDAVGSSNRKLSFEQPITIGNAPGLTPQNHNGKLQASINESSKVALQKWQTGSPFPISGDWRRGSWADLGPMKNEAEAKSLSRHTVSRNWNMNFCENDGLTQLAMKDSKRSPKLSVESPMALDDDRAMKPSICGVWEQSSDVTVPGSGILAGTVEEKCFGDNNFGFVARNQKSTQDILICKSKKSWADMVEEEEQELLSGRTDFLENKWDHPFQESSDTIRNPRKCSDGWDSGEEFNDENLNSNIICHSPCPLNQIKNLEEKLESFDLKDGYSRSGNAISSSNTTVRRSLHFDQQQKPDPVDYFGSLPLPKKALNNFEGNDNNCVPEDGRESIFGKNMKPMRRNRLQVFRDITLLPESP